MFTILGADGKEYGPVATDKIAAWIKGGRANLQTKAKRVDETEWKTLGDFPEFAASAAAMPPPPAAGPTLAAGSAADAIATGGLELAGRWSRLGAVILDSLIGGGFALPGACLMMAGGVMSGNRAFTPLMLAGLAVLGLALLALFIIQVYLLSTRGQTLGKKFLGIKIVTYPDEAPPGFVKAVLLRIVVNGLISLLPMVGSVYGLIDACFIFRDDKRCIHDLIAGTQVVKAGAG